MQFMWCYELPSLLGYVAQISLKKSDPHWYCSWAWLLSDLGIKGYRYSICLVGNIRPVKLCKMTLLFSSNFMKFMKFLAILVNL